MKQQLFGKRNYWKVLTMVDDQELERLGQKGIKTRTEQGIVTAEGDLSGQQQEFLSNNGWFMDYEENVDLK